MPTKKPLIGAAIVGQSGGPSSVINASAYGVIKTALEDENITKVYGAEHGIVGVLEDRLMIMDEEDPAELERLLYTPSSALGSLLLLHRRQRLHGHLRQDQPLYGQGRL